MKNRPTTGFTPSSGKYDADASSTLTRHVAPTAWAGPYAPTAGQPGSTAIFKDDARLEAWATGYENYVDAGPVDPAYQTPAEALGKAVGDSYDIVSLGDNGRITLTGTGEELLDRPEIKPAYREGGRH